MLDIRIPIGFLFLLMGILITIYGIVTGSANPMYAKSLGINMNLWSGISMLIFSAVMLLPVKFFKKK